MNNLFIIKTLQELESVFAEDNQCCDNCECYGVEVFSEQLSQHLPEEENIEKLYNSDKLNREVIVESINKIAKSFNKIYDNKISVNDIEKILCDKISIIDSQLGQIYYVEKRQQTLSNLYGQMKDSIKDGTVTISNIEALINELR